MVRETMPQDDPVIAVISHLLTVGERLSRVAEKLIDHIHEVRLSDGPRLPNTLVNLANELDGIRIDYDEYLANMWLELPPAPPSGG
jgi:hypothetical protein